MQYSVDWARAIDAIDFVASRRPGVSPFRLGMILFFADRRHVLDHGCSITGDRYVAMEHGPVPVAIRGLLKSESDCSDDELSNLKSRIDIELEGRTGRLFSKGQGAAVDDTRGHRAYLDAAIERYGTMTPRDLKRRSCADLAYAKARKAGHRHEIDIGLCAD
ncbi:MAG: Panacea domain-containing protein [Sphingomonas sp.]|uniref:Panacea domain-containing protein n=1 Tax=Sphingomonas sp. TaxID=28214 RepID=UPI00356733BB